MGEKRKGNPKYKRIRKEGRWIYILRHKKHTEKTKYEPINKSGVDANQIIRLIKFRTPAEQRHIADAIEKSSIWNKKGMTDKEYQEYLDK